MTSITPRYSNERAKAFVLPITPPRKYTNPLSRIPRPFKEGSMLAALIAGMLSIRNVKETPDEMAIAKRYAI